MTPQSHPQPCPSPDPAMPPSSDAVAVARYAQAFALLDRAAEVVTSYRTDLDIDRRCIDANPGVPFVWFARPSGTHLWFLPAAESPLIPAVGEHARYLFGVVDRRGYLDNQLAGARCSGERAVRAVYFDGFRAQGVTVARAVTIAQQWHDRLIRNL